VSEFELKLMDIESEHLGIPETEYKCNVRLPAAEFQRIIRGTSVCTSELFTPRILQRVIDLVGTYT
jgi:DNA polymerase III sliding clamp (beta) subunit (PCNA family)